MLRSFRVEGRTIYTTFCCFFIILSIFLIAVYFNLSGWDYNIFCSAVKTVENGKNPYLVENLQEYVDSTLSFVFPPFSLSFLKILCFLDHKIVYYIVWYLILVAVFLILKKVDKKFKSLLMITLLTSGFAATYWNFLTGNIGLVELFLLSLIFYTIIKEKYYLATLFLALMASFKIIPLVFGVLFIFTKVSRSKKITIFLVMLISFFLISILSYLLFPDITPSYYLSLTGRIDEQHTPLIEGGGQDNPASFLLIRGISRLLFGNHFLPSFFLYIFFVGFIAFLFFYYIGKKNPSFLHIFSLGMLAILIILPRLKPYTFVLALIPIYFLIKDFDFRDKFWSLMIVSGGPLFFLILLTNPIWGYNQLACLVIFFIYFIVRDSRATSNYLVEGHDPGNNI